MKWKIISAVVALHLVVGGGLLLSGGCKTPTPASPKNPSGISSSTGGAPTPVAPPVVTSTDTGAPVVNPGATAVIDTPPPATPGDANSINNNGLGGSAPVTAGASTSYTVVKGDNLSRIAKKHNTTIRALQEANNLTSAELKIGQSLVIPASGISSSGLPSVEGSPLAADTTEYTVAKGDSLDRISKKTGVSVTDLKAANTLKSDTIQLGQTLKIPGKHDLKSLAAPAPVAPKKTAPAVVPEGGSSYTVKAGDTPDAIAKRHGMTTKDLLALNANLDPKKLQVGQKLVVKGSAAAPADSLTPVPAGTPSVKPVPATPEPATPGLLPMINLGSPASTRAPVPSTPVPATPVPGNTGEALPITPVTN